MNEITIMDAEWTPRQIEKRKRHAGEYVRKVQLRRVGKFFVGSLGFFLWALFLI